MKQPAQHTAGSNRQRILVIRNRFLGDSILAVPFLRNLRYAFPDAVIDVLTEPWLGEILGLCPYIDNLVYWRRKADTKATGSLTGMLGGARTLKERRYSKCFILRRSFDVALLAFLARIPERIGWGTEGRRLLLTHHTKIADEHEAMRFLRLLSTAGVEIKDDFNEGWTDPAADAKVADAWPTGKGRDIFLFGKPSDPSWIYPMEKMAEIATWLIRERGCRVHFCDHPSFSFYYRGILERIPEQHRSMVTDWSMRLNLRETLSLCRRVGGGIGVDTGFVHVLAQFSKPVVALYGRESPRHWHPWGSDYRALRATPRADGGRVVSDIPVLDVMAAFDSLSGNQG